MTVYNRHKKYYDRLKRSVIENSLSMTDLPLIIIESNIL